MIAAQIDVFNPGLSSVLAGMGPHCQISQLDSRKQTNNMKAALHQDISVDFDLYGVG